MPAQIACVVGLLAFGGVLSLHGCDMAAYNAKLEREQVVRRALFKECMQLAAKLERKADDDVADVVNACSSQSHYMAVGTP